MTPRRSGARIEVTRADELAPPSVERSPRFARGTYPHIPVGTRGELPLDPLLLAAVERWEPGSFRPRQNHRGIEIVRVMLRGTLVHQDSSIGRCFVGSDDVTVLSTGAGVEQQESVLFDEPAHAVVFWLRSSAPDAPAHFAQHTFSRAARVNTLLPIVYGSDRVTNALHINADVTISSGALEAGTTAAARSRRGCGYLISTVGRVVVNGVIVEPGDRIVIRGRDWVRVQALEPTDVVMLDL